MRSLMLCWESLQTIQPCRSKLLQDLLGLCEGFRWLLFPTECTPKKQPDAQLGSSFQRNYQKILQNILCITCTACTATAVLPHIKCLPFMALQPSDTAQPPPSPLSPPTTTPEQQFSRRLIGSAWSGCKLPAQREAYVKYQMWVDYKWANNFSLFIH